MATNDMDAITLSDFAAILTDTGVDVTLNRATKAVAAITGSETLSFGSNVTITVQFQLNKNRFSVEKEGELAQGDATMYSKIADSVDRNDKITYRSVVYLVKDVTQRGSFDKCILFRWDDA